MKQPAPPHNVLQEICTIKRQHIAKQKQQIDEATLHTHAAQAKSPRGFLHALRNKIADKRTALIAEVKKASPSQGVIRADFDPTTIAAAYESGGATCLSVLTDTPYFQGEDAYLQQVKRACTLPVLRKDFMLDPYQVLESRALGADCILLIMNALSDAQAGELEAAAHALHMDVLVEVHDEHELERALALKSTLLGINNRDLRSMQVSLDVSERLCALVPDEYTLICESGIHTPHDIARMQAHNIYGFLVGESLMRKEDIKTATQALLSAG